MHGAADEENVTGDYILLAEDDRLIANVFSEGLSGAGFPVKVAHSGNEAMQTMKCGSPRLAIVDIRLPDMSGLDLVRRFAKGSPPFFVISGVRAEETINEAIGLGALGYFVKPIEVAQLLPLVRAVLARAGELTRMRNENRKLSEAIDHARSISTAIGILMERYRLEQTVAATALRFLARSQRRKMHTVAHDIVEASLVINLPREILRQASPK